MLQSHYCDILSWPGSEGEALHPCDCVRPDTARGCTRLSFLAWAAVLILVWVAYVLPPSITARWVQTRPAPFASGLTRSTPVASSASSRVFASARSPRSGSSFVQAYPFERAVPGMSRETPGTTPTSTSPEGPSWPSIPAPPDLGGQPVRSWSPTALAFLGDAVWELYLRQSFFAPQLALGAYTVNVGKAACAEAQAACVKKLLDADFATDVERQVLKWGRNSVLRNAGIPKRLRGNSKGANIYRTATAFECLIGYLHVTDPQRLREVMDFLGFPTSAVPADPPVFDPETFSDAELQEPR